MKSTHPFHTPMNAPPAVDVKAAGTGLRLPYPSSHRLANGVIGRTDPATTKRNTLRYYQAMEACFTGLPTPNWAQIEERLEEWRIGLAGHLPRAEGRPSA
ncbi:hypothetical protein FNU76_17140 [Chitinimonas arctica]|uniref:Uncharacterized protein n=1 Tax=Chitinimonas arctica TaxID=2594795 RepID=A0A516SIE8_9NEIS|nr:hypothetical protein [Chitinimonas arctica]QDQ27929.1 hypothetical protein FNU76_17140 [Chitinimonas arctica]